MRLRRPRTPAAWLEAHLGLPVVLGPQGADEPHPRHEPRTLVAGLVGPDVVLLLTHDALLVARGATLERRALHDPTRLVWVADRPPAVGDGRVAVSHGTGVELRRPTGPMALGRVEVEPDPTDDLLGATLPGVGDAPVVAATRATAGWGLLLEDGTVVAATTSTRRLQEDGPPAPDGSLPADRPVVVDPPDDEVRLLQQRHLEVQRP